jgi:hypothetical protein
MPSRRLTSGGYIASLETVLPHILEDVPLAVRQKEVVLS